MDVATVAGALFAVVTAGVIAFQVALALGAPWGEYAMGGAFPGRYPAPMRVVALVQAAVLGVLAVAVLSFAGIVGPAIAAAVPWLIWVIVIVTALGVLMNAISRSAGERRIWVPVTLVMLACSLLVALGR